MQVRQFNHMAALIKKSHPDADRVRVYLNNGMSFSGRWGFVAPAESRRPPIDIIAIYPNKTMRTWVLIPIEAISHIGSLSSREHQG
jgi:hypothetical protein